MIRILIISITLFLGAALMAQNTVDPAALKKQMSDIRINTNWDNPEEAKRANDSIKVLSKKLSDFYRQQNAPADETEEQKILREQNQDYKDKLWDQIIKTAKKGKGAEVSLGDVVREEIIKEFEEEEAPKKKSAGYYQAMNFLCLDMSSPAVQEIIDVMENFRSIRVMVITGGASGMPADFKTIFSKAADYPLKELYIINFGALVKDVPEEVQHYKDLVFLSLINNSIDQLPSLKSLKQLQTLYVDVNPLSSIIGSISSLKQLKVLGIGKTGISESEKDNIEKLLPDCQIEQP